MHDIRIREYIVINCFENGAIQMSFDIIEAELTDIYFLSY